MTNNKVLIKSFTTNQMPNIQLIYQYAVDTIKYIPSHLYPYAKDIHIKVENFADPKTLKSLDIKDKYDLLGLYKGVPLAQKQSFDCIAYPDTIFLYRASLIRYALDDEKSMQELVQCVVLHELAHHFGYKSYQKFWYHR